MKALGILLGRFPALSDSEALAMAYFDDASKDNQNARAVVTEHGITNDQIVAEAMLKRGEGLLLFDRMESHRASASRSLRKDIDRWFQAGNEPPEASPG